MYSVSPEAAELWRALLSAVIDAARLPVSMQVIDHEPPAPIEALWARRDLGAVFMCGLPFSRATVQPSLLAAPVPSPAEYADRPRYWSEMVVRADGPCGSLEDTFGGRLALTVPESQSGYAAALAHLMTVAGPSPRYREIIAPAVTPLGAVLAVVRGEADVAPVDSYAFSLLQRFRPELTAQVRSVGRTPATPIPALVTSPDLASLPGMESLQTAFLEAHRNAPMKALMDELLLTRFVAPQPAAYHTLRERHVAALTYWQEHPLAAVIHPAFVL